MLEQAPKDRQIQKFPSSYLPSTTPYIFPDFKPEVRLACVSNRMVAAGLKISKVLLLGNLSVGKSCLVNR